MTSILKVSEIQDPTNSNTALSIDTSGRITMPNKPMFAAGRSANSARTESSTYVVVPWDTATINDGNYDTSTYAYTTPVAGVYMFSYNIRIDNANTATYMIGNLSWDGAYFPPGSSVQEGYVIASGYASYFTLNYSGLFNLDAGVVVKNHAFVATDTSWDISEYGQFNGFLVG